MIAFYSALSNLLMGVLRWSISGINQSFYVLGISLFALQVLRSLL